MSDKYEIRLAGQGSGMYYASKLGHMKGGTIERGIWSDAWYWHASARVTEGQTVGRCRKLADAKKALLLALNGPE